MPTPVPPLLDVYLKPQPSGSLTLVTSVLDATSNWLLLRLLYAAINGVNTTARRYGAEEQATTQALTNEKYNVVLISFLRGIEFWRTEAKRLGLDFNTLIAQQRLLFLDGLSHLFLPSQRPTPPQSRGAPTALTYTKLQALQDTISSQIAAFAKSDTANGSQGGNTVLIIDGLDLLLAATPDAESIGSAAGSSSTAAIDMMKLCLSFRSLPSVHTVVAAVSADGPLLHHSVNPTPLESGQQAFLISLAHQARLVLQLRPLETGRAQDVSGVIRASRGGAWEEPETDVTSTMSPGTGASGQSTLLEGEWLYHIVGNGEAKVWGRGEAGLS